MSVVDRDGEVEVGSRRLKMRVERWKEVMASLTSWPTSIHASKCQFSTFCRITFCERDGDVNY